MKAIVAAPRMIQPKSSLSPGLEAICGRNWTPWSRSTAMISVPRLTPRSLPLPPTMMQLRNARVSMYAHAEGDHPPMNPASSAPLSPPNAPPTAWTTRRRRTTSLPAADAAVSSSRIARSVRPIGPVVKRRSTTKPIRQHTATNATYAQRAVSGSRLENGLGMSARPAVPLKSPMSALTIVVTIRDTTSIATPW